MKCKRCEQSFVSDQYKEELDGSLYLSSYCEWCEPVIRLKKASEIKEKFQVITKEVNNDKNIFKVFWY